MPDTPAHPEALSLSKGEGHPTLPDFTPVPRLQNRRDGWAPAVQRAFIEGLADTGSVEAACRLVDRSPASAYRLRRHPEGAEFAAAWQAAIDFGIRRIEDLAIDRAINGVEVPVFAYGDRIATRRVYNDQLVMFMLRNRAPERYCDGGAKGLNALDARMLEKLKKEWREEWKRQDAMESAAREREHGDSLIEQIKQMHLRWYCMLTPAARAAYREFRRLEDEDRRGEWMYGDDPEPLSVAEAEYEEFFGEGRDRRAHIAKLVDMREWEEEEEEEEEEE